MCSRISAHHDLSTPSPTVAKFFHSGDPISSSPSPSPSRTPWVPSSGRIERKRHEGQHLRQGTTSSQVPSCDREAMMIPEEKRRKREGCAPESTETKRPTDPAGHGDDADPGKRDETTTPDGRGERRCRRSHGVLRSDRGASRNGGEDSKGAPRAHGSASHRTVNGRKIHKGPPAVQYSGKASGRVREARHRDVS